MPKKFSSQERSRRRRAWMNSTRSLNGRIFQLEHDLLERCIQCGLGVKGIARLLHIGPVRVRYLLRKHGLKLQAQPADSAALNEHNARLHAEKAARLLMREVVPHYRRQRERENSTEWQSSMTRVTALLPKGAAIAIGTTAPAGVQNKPSIEAPNGANGQNCPIPSR